VPAPTPIPQAPTAPAPPGAIEDPERGNPAVEEDDPRAAAEAERDREIERNRERYDAARERFGSEPRDEAWAAEQERLLSSLAGEIGPGELVEAVECRNSMCQLRLRSDALIEPANFERLGPLVKALGSERVGRYEGTADQRKTLMYMPRDGHWPDTAADDPAPAAP
jgi:hypothetical protein